MKSILVLVTLVSVVLSGFHEPAQSEVAPRQLGFRVRSDFSVGLNSDEGWAGRINENVKIYADRPFRVRFEAELIPATTGSQRCRLQYRRNDGSWTDIEAHDFPHPDAEIELDFTTASVGSTPEAWRVARGNAMGLAVANDGQRNALRAKADHEPLTVLYSQSPESAEFEFETELRLSDGNQTGAGLVFGYVDAENYYSVFLDAVRDTIRVSRFVDGMETVLAKELAAITAGKWLELAIDFEDEELEVSFDDEILEFKVDVGAIRPTGAFGFQVPGTHAADFQEFKIVGEPKTPPVSIVSCSTYKNGAATIDLLKEAASKFRAGAGMSLADRTPSWTGGGHREFEWSLVVRRFADGAVTNDEGDTFELRMVGAGGRVMSSSKNPVLQLTVPPGHVGGTFVETPGRIGPWQASNGDLYFIMEPSETDNIFMMIKSTDSGRTWHEVDGTNRPRTDDLESVDARQIGDTVHIIHQVTKSVWYHAFRTSDHPDRPDSWGVRDELAARANAVAQAAALVVRSDGSMVAFYVGQTKIHYSIRSPAGVWNSQTIVDSDVPPNLAGPQAVLGANDTAHLAYHGTDGTIWYRRLLRDGTLTNRQRLTSSVGTTRAEYGAVLPLLFVPETNTVVIIYRLASGVLWERRIANDGPPSTAARVTDRSVVQDAVDSQQPGGDAVLDGTTVHVLYIDQSSRGIFSTHDKRGWQPSTLRVDKILGSWVRGNVYSRADGVKVYGYVYDAGSDGGAGMNRFGEIVLNGHDALVK